MFDGGAVRELLRVAQEIVSFDARDAGDRELMDEVMVLERVRSLIDVAVGRDLVELEAREACETHVGQTAATWLSLEAGVPRSVAAQRLKVARRLRDSFDEVEAAVVEGRASWEQARVLAQAANPRIVDRMAEVQGPLLDAARLSSFEVWRREVAGVAELLDEDGGHDPHNDLDRNRLRLATTFNGVVDISGQLTAEQGAVAVEAIDAVADELFRAYRRDAEQCPDLTVPAHGTLQALAFVELCRRGLATDVAATQAPRADVTVVVRADDPDHAVTGHGTILPAEATRLVTCDADVSVLRVDDAGVPLDLGRRTRLATPGQRRALRVRDGGCIFPGCDAPFRWCDAHHVTEWDHGGPTDLANLATLCRRHHGITHRNGWTMRAIDRQTFEWTSPSGTVLRSQRHHRQRPDAAAA